MSKVCVIGWPITHSRSPLIHNYWINMHKLNATYEKQAVAPENLHHFIATMKEQGYVGCNVTIPHKEMAISSIDLPDDRVKKIGALNTIFFHNGKSCGTSTDGEGFFQNLLSQVADIDLHDKSVVVLGAGGAARAIVDKLLEESPKAIHVINRSVNRAQQIQTDFGETVKAGDFQSLKSLLPTADLFVNATSMGMTGQEPLEVALELLPKTAVVADIVYVPLKTSLIQNAETLGLRTVPGLGMLLHQAVRGFELWFGIRPKVTIELYDLVAQDIDPGYRS
ncbi:MAG: shikimate dehydrogenase [Aestuariivirga sp.]